MSDDEDLTLDGTTNQVKISISIASSFSSSVSSLQSSYGMLDDDDDDEGTRGSNSRAN